MNSIYIFIKSNIVKIINHVYNLVNEVIRVHLYILGIRAKGAYSNVITVANRHETFRFTYLEFNVFHLNIFFCNYQNQPN